jgi:hypothetical protein
MVLNIPLDECIDNTQDLVTREKRKRKEMTNKTNKRSKAKEKAKSKITWRRASLTPLRQGQRLDTSETKPH